MPRGARNGPPVRGARVRRARRRSGRARLRGLGRRRNARARAVIGAGELQSGSRAARVGRWLGPLLFAAVYLLPLGDLTQRQRAAAAVAALTATWWVTEAVPIGFASLLPVALFPLLGVLSAKQAAPHYFDDVVMLFLGAMLLALGLERWNLHRRIALAILARVGSAPNRLVLGFLIASVFLSLWLNNTAAALMLLPIGIAVARGATGSDAPTPLVQALLFAIAYGVSVGGMGTPIGTAPNQVLIGQLHSRYPDAPELGFGAWMLGWAPVLVLWIPLAWWVLTRRLRTAEVPVARGGAAEIARERAALGRWKAPERRMGLLFAATALLWITRGDLELGSVSVPGWQRLLPAFDGETANVSDATVALVMAGIGFLLPGEAGGRLLDWKITERMPWDVLLLIGGGFCLAAGVRACGLDATIGAGLASWIEGRPSWQVELVVVASIALFSEIASNTATAQVLLPVLATAAQSAGLNPLVVMLPATLAASVGFMLPVGTPPNALAYATRMIPAPRMAKVGALMDVLLIALIVLVFHFWLKPLWGLEDALPSWAHRG
ncbi:MAG: SLC13/DASS family transporter [Planctomycetota bacterium]|nr:MAG: SLC13/DASS family transporter [Planctomycetota bacterium]